MCKSIWSPTHLLALCSSKQQGWFMDQFRYSWDKVPTYGSTYCKMLSQRSAKLYQYPFLDAEFKNPVLPLKTGKEFLDDLGQRIIVHLPGDRKIVVRGQLNEPIMKVFQEVCSERHLQQSDYCVTNPKTGTILDPLDTFTNQNVDQIELKEWRDSKFDQYSSRSSENYLMSSSKVGYSMSTLPRFSSSDPYSENDIQSLTLSSDVSNGYSKPSVHVSGRGMNNVKRKCKKHTAPSIPPRQLTLDQHISPFTLELEKRRSISCTTLPSTLPKKKDFSEALNNTRYTVQDFKSDGSAMYKPNTQEIVGKSLTDIPTYRSSAQRLKATIVLKPNSKKQSEASNSSCPPPPPPPPLPANFFKGNSCNSTNLCTENCRKSESDLLKARSSVLEVDEKQDSNRSTSQISKLSNPSSSSLSSCHTLPSSYGLTGVNTFKGNPVSLNVKTLNINQKQMSPAPSLSSFTKPESLGYSDKSPAPNMDLVTELTNAFKRLQRSDNTDEIGTQKRIVKDVCSAIRKHSQDASSPADNNQMDGGFIKPEPTTALSVEEWDDLRVKKAVSTTFWAGTS
ncbi:unnamed protein product [Heterobilharzia americana]|nr:unnamed protein product [Heterobilharzia americana]